MPTCCKVKWHSDNYLKDAKAYFGLQFQNNWIIKHNNVWFSDCIPSSIISLFVAGFKILFFLFLLEPSLVGSLFILCGRDLATLNTFGFSISCIDAIGVYTSLAWFAMHSFPARPHRRKLVVALQCISVGDGAIRCSILHLYRGNSPYEWYWEILQRSLFSKLWRRGLQISL